jgi:hypothetical protein
MGLVVSWFLLHPELRLNTNEACFNTGAFGASLDVKRIAILHLSAEKDWSMVH